MILHIDMDAYFASVEQLDNPELRGKPVIICGQSKRSVVSTASYEARKFGVHSAMPYFQAKKLCPEGLFIRGRMSRYKEISISIFDLLYEFTPVVEPVSIDEAYLDITGCERIIGEPEVAALKIKQTIYEKTGLTCSVGGAPLKFLSKIASDLNKPDGITIITKGDVHSFIKKLDIKKVPGVGKATYKNLEKLSVKTLGDVDKISESTLTKVLGIQGARLKKLSKGIDFSIVSNKSVRKSISTETTFSEDIDKPTEIKKFLLFQSDDIARQLRKKKVRAKTITLKITFSDFQQVTRRHTLDTSTQSAKTINKEAVLLFEKENCQKKIRLIGVGCASLVPEVQLSQSSMFEEKNESLENWEKAEKAIDSILTKFGKSSVERAVFSKKN